MKTIMEDFRALCRLPSVHGAIDGPHGYMDKDYFCSKTKGIVLITLWLCSNFLSHLAAEMCIERFLTCLCFNDRLQHKHASNGGFSKMFHRYFCGTSRHYK